MSCAHVKRAGRLLSTVAALLAAAALCALLAAAGTASARAGAARRATDASTPPATITAQPIERVPHTARPGQLVRASQLLGNRVFVDGQHGVALAEIGQAQYPAATQDSGTVWRVSGPALHLNAAQAPLVVERIGALSSRVYFAFGAGEVVDTTNDGGAHWYRALLGAAVEAVVPNAGRLLAFVISPPSATLVYASADGGRHWHHETSL